MAPIDHLNVMNFLNEIANDFPKATSLAAGRPSEHLFDSITKSWISEMLARYESATHSGCRSFAELLQYGRTAGLIPELAAAQLHTDQMVPAKPNQTIITSGCQEALFLALRSICSAPGEVLLLPNPTYVGAVGAADTCKVETFSIQSGDLAAGVHQSVEELSQAGKTPRALYVIPDYDNPTGKLMDESERRALIEACGRHKIIILEDGAYSLFRFEGEAVLPLAALDDVGCVLFLATYSKTIAPGLRVGSVVLPDTIFGSRAARQKLMSEIVQRKSYLTVNTNTLAQAIVGGLLLEQNCSLVRWVLPSLSVYRHNRDTMMARLARAFPGENRAVTWNKPLGGFFLSVSLPFEFSAGEIVECAKDFGVVVMPMSFFASDNSQDRKVRLSFSPVSADQIAEATDHFCAYVEARPRRRARTPA